MAFFWTVLTVGFGVLEASTAQLVSIWLAGGAFAALIASLCHLSFWWQMGVFIIVSALLLILTRPIARRLRRREAVPTNKDALIGTVAIVTEDIDNISECGALKLHGITWTARSTDASAIPAGTHVKICSVSGVKLFVEKYEEV